MTTAERAKECAEKMTHWWWEEYNPSDNPDFAKADFETQLMLIIAKALDATAADARREGIELAAKECDAAVLKFETEANRYYPDTSSYDDYARSAGQARDLASRIRALQAVSGETVQ